MQTEHTDPTLLAREIPYLEKLILASRPFIKINSVERLDWRRIIKDPKDKRNGPWNYRADYEVIDEKVWSQSGEVLYFVIDKNNHVRLIGQSINKLKDRWRMSPMFDVKTLEPLNMHSLFHTSAWPEIEAGFSRGDSMKFTLHAIFRADLEKACHSIGGPLLSLLKKPETHLQRLSYHVEQWVCSLSSKGLNLWNKSGTGRKRMR